MTQHTPELEAGARAMRSKIDEYMINCGCAATGIPWCEPHMPATVEIGYEPVFDGTHAACGQWIDRQAFAAGLAAILPVSGEMGDAVLKVLWIDAEIPMQRWANLGCALACVTAAINHIIGGAKG